MVIAVCIGSSILSILVYSETQVVIVFKKSTLINCTPQNQNREHVISIYPYLDIYFRKKRCQTSGNFVHVNKYIEY